MPLTFGLTNNIKNDYSKISVVFEYILSNFLLQHKKHFSINIDLLLNLDPYEVTNFAYAEEIDEFLNLSESIIKEFQDNDFSHLIKSYVIKYELFEEDKFAQTDIIDFAIYLKSLCELALQYGKVLVVTGD
ncbi:hypothetical protein [Alkalihalobacillus deserti]|uniref:hypothetical protein n=1 Tax=Alkalihalobacillus deserti TaxID=2879466 RepID=UPI001D147782|nr:hypothetical protein [Alkalihalobacillus deserti]